LAYLFDFLFPPAFCTGPKLLAGMFSSETPQKITSVIVIVKTMGYLCVSEFQREMWNFNPKE
jgi:hypothetical protein